MKILSSPVLPAGFKASGAACGLKKSGALDLALIYTRAPAKAGCLFTTNKILAAPVLLCKEYLRKSGGFHAIIANSGNANCFTGKQGIADARSVSGFVGKELGVPAGSVLVFSTGIIGKRLDAAKIGAAVPGLCAQACETGLSSASKAIMTTDLFPKEISVQSVIGGKTVTVTGIAKGAGMICPNMATMLAFVMTDADISVPALNKALKTAVRTTFNCITVDGCMSTNDSLVVLANGMAGNRRISSSTDTLKFAAVLEFVCLQLAKMMVRDGEGATKFITINVRGARSFEEARTAALAIANSNLFKTAVYGQNPNFGRIAAAVGASGIDVSESGLKVKLGPLEGKEVSVDVGLSRGKASCTVYTSDLTPEYIKINAEYN